MSIDRILIHVEQMESLSLQHNWSIEHDGVVAVVLSMIGLCEGPVYFSDRVIAGFLGTSVAKWHSLRDELVEDGVLYLTDEGHVYLRGEGDLFKFQKHGRKSLPTNVREAANRRTNNCCAYCGTLSGPFHHDHLLPHARGGSNEPSNIVLACQACNTSKGDKTLIEWVAFLRNREGRQ